MLKYTTIEKLFKLCPEQFKKVELVLTKFISQEPLTDKERAKDPEVWARAERFFDFKTGKALETEPAKDESAA